MNKKKNAVVIGATGNLGQAIVKALRNADYKIDEIWASENRPDVTLSSSFKNLPSRIDMAVYAAGVNLVKPIQEISDEEWEHVMRVNITGAFYFARAAFASLREAKGTFVTISSMNAVVPYPNRVAYSSSKAAIEGLTRQLAVEWGDHGISTHAIRLGPLNKLMATTKANPLILEATKKRLPQHELIPAEAVADYIVSLGSGIAPWVTGSVIDFDAGFMLNAYPLV